MKRVKVWGKVESKWRVEAGRDARASRGAVNVALRLNSAELSPFQNGVI